MSGQLEFGAPVANCFKLPDLRAQRKSLPTTMLGKVIVGKATAYAEWHVAMSGQVEVFTFTCFEKSLKGGLHVDLLLDHDPLQKIGSTKDGRLELCNANEGLWFRFFPSPEAKHQNLLAAVGDGDRTSMSIGYTVLEDEFFKTEDGIEVRMISEAILGEISLLKPDHGAVKSTKVFVVDTLELGSFEKAARSGRLEIMGSLRCPLALVRGSILKATGT